MVTEVERKKRGEKSTVIVERLVFVQLRAMGCTRFELGIQRADGEMILREGRLASISTRQSNGFVMKTQKEPMSTSGPPASMP